MPAKKTAKKAVKKTAKPTAETPAEAPAPKPTEVKLGAAKGRPMLQWVGKKPLSRVTAFPAQLVETFDPGGELASVSALKASGNLYYGDNKEVLAHMLANGYRGKVGLIYIDPPFDSAADYVSARSHCVAKAPSPKSKAKPTPSANRSNTPTSGPTTITSSSCSSD